MVGPAQRFLWREVHDLLEFGAEIQAGLVVIRR
jgi:hypothetical protein